jgi:hypothetical protein
LRQEVQDLMRGGPPTAELLRPVGPTVPSDDGVGWAVYGALSLFAHFGSVIATGFAATVVGVTNVPRRG